MVAAIFICSVSYGMAADNTTMRDRRKRAASEFHDGILFVHALSRLDIAADGYRQNPYFYYFTGLQNTVGALLAIDGSTAESWLFLPSRPPFVRAGLQPEIGPGAESANRVAIEHVMDWSELEGFLGQRSKPGIRLYYTNDPAQFPEMPSNLFGTKASDAPLWVQLILQKWPAAVVQEIGDQLNALMSVQSSDEVDALRSAAKATVTAFSAGLRAIRPGVSQRTVESAVGNACWSAEAHGSAFWPWAMAGKNGVFPKPFTSLALYDHLNDTMRAGDLIRLDVGCEWEHYQGDLGRTVPVSGHYRDDQRETWNIFVAAYKAGVALLHDGTTVDEVYDAWRAELLKHRASAKSLLAQHAIDSWSKRDNVPFWQIHTTNLVAGRAPDPLRAGVILNFEPIASVDGQGFFMEDMYLVKKTSAEILTPGVPYTAEQIESAMK
jgi:Xaa-Pro aminopeptidase